METIDLRDKVILYTDVKQLLYEIKSEIMKEENGRMDILSYIEDKIRTLEYIDKEIIDWIDDYWDLELEEEEKADIVMTELINLKLNEEKKRCIK